MSLIPAGTTAKIETKWFPPLTVELSDTGGEPGPIVKFLKPKVTLAIKGQILTSAAPAGEPTPNEWPKVKIGLAVVVGLAVFSILRIFR